jgi:HEAT repeat protein
MVRTAAIPGLEIPPPMALSIVLACIAAALYAVRAYQRRARRHDRRRLRRFVRNMAHHLDDEYAAADLQRDAAECSEGEFWSALERVSARLRRRQWLRLSATLAGGGFVRAERRALRDDSSWRRVLAARRLALLVSRPSRAALRRALTRGPELVTFACATSLGRYRDVAALRWVLQHPARVANRPFVSLVSLFRAFGRHAGPVLTAALGQGIDAPRVERAAIETLGLLGEPNAREVIERHLSSPAVDLRVAAARALGRMEATESGTALLRALRDDEWPVRAQAARALGRAQVVIATHALAERLTDRSWWVRRHAAYALGALGEEGVRTLRHIESGSPDPYARDIAREVLEGGVDFAA